MRRYLVPITLLLALVLAAIAQRPTTATPTGESADSYLPIAALPFPPTATPTATLTATPEPTATATLTATPEPTATQQPTGTGVFYRNLLEYYDWSGTMTYGFVRFWNGSPAFGGPSNFHVYVALDCGGLYRSSDLDGTGYYQIPINGFPSLPLECPGRAWLMKGPVGSEQRVSNDFAIDTRNGSCWRMDFIECQAGDPSASCQLPTGQAALGRLEIVQTESAIAAPCP